MPELKIKLNKDFYEPGETIEGLVTTVGSGDIVAGTSELHFPVFDREIQLHNGIGLSVRIIGKGAVFRREKSVESELGFPTPFIWHPNDLYPVDRIARLPLRSEVYMDVTDMQSLDSSDNVSICKLPLNQNCNTYLTSSVWLLLPNS